MAVLGGPCLLLMCWVVVGVMMGGAGSEVRLTAGVVIVCGGVRGGDRLVLPPQLLGWTQSQRAGRVSFPREFLGGVSTTVPEPLGIGRGSEIQSPLTAISRVSPVDEALSGGADNGPWLSDFDIKDFLHVFIVGGDLEHGTGRVLDTRDVDRDDVSRHSLPSHVVPVAMDSKNLGPQSGIKVSSHFLKYQKSERETLSYGMRQRLKNSSLTEKRVL